MIKFRGRYIIRAEDKLAKIPEKGSIFLYRGCISKSKYPGIEVSTQKTLRLLGFEVYTSQDEACCGGLAYFSGFMPFKSFATLIGWNLSIAKKYAENLVTPCNGCYASFYHVLKDIDKKGGKVEVEKVLHKVGVKPAWDIKVFHVAEVFYKVKEKIIKLQKVKLNGLKVACHYGCHYLKTFPEEVLGSAENPTFMDELVELLGGKVVNYEEKHICCGGDFFQPEYTPEVSLKITEAKLRNIREAEADLLLVPCPMCLSVFDEAPKKGDKNLGLPVLHISEFIGLILGLDPLKDLGLQAHLTPVNIPQTEDYLKKFKSLRRTLHQ